MLRVAKMIEAEFPEVEMTVLTDEEDRFAQYLYNQLFDAIVNVDVKYSDEVENDGEWKLHSVTAIQ